MAELCHVLVVEAVLALRVAALGLSEVYQHCLAALVSLFLRVLSLLQASALGHTRLSATVTLKDVKALSTARTAVPVTACCGRGRPQAPLLRPLPSIPRLTVRQLLGWRCCKVSLFGVLQKTQAC